MGFMELDILKDKKVAELREIAKALGIKGASGMKKQEIVDLLTRMHEEAEKEKAAAAEKEAKKAAPKTKRTAKKNAEPASEPAAGKPEKAAKRAAKPKKAQPFHYESTKIYNTLLIIGIVLAFAGIVLIVVGAAQ